MSPLEARKQLLIAESELDRSKLVGDVEAMAVGVRSLTDRAKSLSAIASSAALLAAGYAALKRGQTVDSSVKPSRWQSIRKGAGLISAVWLALRSRRREQQRTSLEENQTFRFRS